MRELKTPALNDTDQMPFGKHKGELMQDVPASYLLYLWNQDCNNLLVKNYIYNSMSAIRQDCPDTIPNKTFPGYPL